MGFGFFLESQERVTHTEPVQFVVGDLGPEATGVLGGWIVCNVLPTTALGMEVSTLAGLVLIECASADSWKHFLEELSDDFHDHQESRADVCSWTLLLLL